MVIRFLNIFFAYLCLGMPVGGNSPSEDKSHITQYVLKVDQNSNVTLPCLYDKHVTTVATGSLAWFREGKNEKSIHHSKVLPNGSLFLIDVSIMDEGVYKCVMQGEKDTDLSIATLNIRSTPGLIKNITVIPSSVLAVVRWEKPENGGYSITSYTLRYRTLDEDIWQSFMSGHIPSTINQVDVYKLEPNTTYVFQIWANNKLGSGTVNELEFTTQHSRKEVELARHLLVGAETFDTRTWLVAVFLVFSALIFLGFGTCFIFYREYRKSSSKENGDEDTEEVMELVPHIITNPGYHDENQRWSTSEPDEEFYQITFHLNNSVQLTNKSKSVNI
ncbi:unnamed protein product [Bemisia tabaci]|uniref:Uncharacterized protein n=1 Tax=Bemisia tabaci TaxID=7038 RepID=A0A9P0ADI9_BEMTA|nr:PREDICTED: uncharacterized protein LOC109037443 [Bemisia tabaci]CAH0390413.1 unnamed protein product [Bemisia tabaci]